MGVWLLACMVTLAAFSGYEQHTFDAYVHLFFADHYMRGWFELWEPRWYGGFSVTSYPPLVHQVLALFARVVGLERAFDVVMALVVSAIAFGAAAVVKRFARVEEREKAAALGLFLAALIPTIPRFAYVYGQLPTLAATPLVLIALLALDDYLREGRLLALLTYGALVGTVGGAHHISVIFAVLGSAMVAANALDRARGKRVLAAGALAALALGSVVWPFLRHAAAAPQAEIPHASRLAIWQRPFDLEVFELVILLGIAAITLVAAARAQRRSVWIYAAGFTLLVLLSAGGTTPLPELLFRGQARWLTYDKFQVWASVLVIIALASWWRRPTRLGVALVTCLLVPLCIWGVSHKEARKLQPPFVRDISAILRVLNQPDAERYRHLALGFGDQGCRFDIYGKSPNIDGDYHTARNHPMLRASGISTLDSAKYYDKGPEVLDTILREADAQSLRWVLVLDDWYYPHLFEAGFELKDVLENGVAIFEKDVPPIAQLVAPTAPRLAAWTWGVMPLFYLFTSLALLSGAKLASARQDP